MRGFAAPLFIVVFAGAVAGQELALGPDEPRLARAAALERSHGVSVRWDETTGTPASIRFERPVLLRGATPEECARNLVADVSDLFERGVLVSSPELAPAAGPALVLRGTRDLGAGRVRVDLEQVVAGVPVLEAGLAVELASSEEGSFAVAISGRYFPGVPDRRPSISPELAAELAERFPVVRRGELEGAPSRRPVFAAAGAEVRPAVEVTALLGEPPLAWRILVDAATGRELSRAPLSCAATVEGLVYEKNPGETPRASRPIPGLHVNQGANRVVTDANGAHNLAGTVTLDQALSGPSVRVFIDNEQELAYSGPADVRLAPAEDSAAQDELAAFHHVMTFHAHLGKTYPGVRSATNVRWAVLVRAKRNGQPFANAFFSPAPVTLAGDSFPGYIGLGTFGNGTRQAARSSSVVRHEYTHALMSRVAQLTGSLEAAGLNEGFADYFPCAEVDDPRVGAWVATPSLRDLTRKLVWPTDNNNDPHRVGHIFAGALWDARTRAAAGAAGRRLEVDQAVMGGILRLRARPTLVDARTAIVEADRAVNGGRNVALLEQAFFERGIGPRPAPTQNSAPVIATLADRTASPGVTLAFDVKATDQDGDPVTYAASALANAAIDAKTGRFTFTPDASQLGARRVTFTATDGRLSASASITIDVSASATVPSGSVAPLPSSAAPGAGQVVPAATTPSFAPARKSGGGGGCMIDGTGEIGAGAVVPYLTLLAACAARRRQRRSS